ncbi:MAG: hypothetical protein HC889_09045 [Synechococcaceae cyanobacterium SM1_2_3]|nr:hypothetical protein [Synechococcaceae cyanobacterium SM1_2_3]
MCTTRCRAASLPTDRPAVAGRGQRFQINPGAQRAFIAILGDQQTAVEQRKILNLAHEAQGGKVSSEAASFATVQIADQVLSAQGVVFQLKALGQGIDGFIPQPGAAAANFHLDLHRQRHAIFQGVQRRFAKAIFNLGVQAEYVIFQPGIGADHLETGGAHAGGPKQTQQQGGPPKPVNL